MAEFLPGAVDSSNHEIDNSQNTTGSVEKIKVKVLRPRAAISLIFTHGEGAGDDDMGSASMVNFSQGFAKHLPLLMFDGSKSITSRIEEYKKTMGATNHCNNIGGRGMGGIAAARCVDENTKHVVLVSYPLRKDSEVRDTELLALPHWVKVIFVSGDRDHLLDIDELDAVREKMKAQTWRVIVRGADHQMRMIPERGTKAVGMEVGGIVADWLKQREHLREGELRWNDDYLEVEWSGWVPYRPLTMLEF
ncbi:hypothetical protein MMC30_005136 [Trapelia coarctata]|nr:hypothetical protein [Trapelia coarctata]